MRQQKRDLFLCGRALHIHEHRRLIHQLFAVGCQGDGFLHEGKRLILAVQVAEAGNGKVADGNVIIALFPKRRCLFIVPLVIQQAAEQHFCLFVVGLCNDGFKDAHFLFAHGEGRQNVRCRAFLICRVAVRAAKVTVIAESIKKRRLRRFRPFVQKPLEQADIFIIQPHGIKVRHHVHHRFKRVAVHDRVEIGGIGQQAHIVVERVLCKLFRRDSGNVLSERFHGDDLHGDGK